MRGKIEITVQTANDDLGKSLTFLEISHAFANHVEVKAFLTEQAKAHTNHCTDAIGGQRAEQYRIFTQETEPIDGQQQGCQSSQGNTRTEPEETESHQSDHDSTPNNGKKLEERSNQAFHGHQLETNQDKHHKGGGDRHGKCPVGDPVPIETGNHR